MTFITCADLARTLDVDVEAVATVAGEITDSELLWSDEHGAMTEQGAELVTMHFRAHDVSTEELLTDVEEATARLEAAREALDATREDWERAVIRATGYGVQRTRIARAAGISRSRLYQLIDDRS